MDEKSKSNFYEFILENQFKVLLVLDGLDEADQSKQELNSLKVNCFQIALFFSHLDMSLVRKLGASAILCGR